MYGVPPDLALDVLHGAEIVQLCVGEHQIILNFHPSGYISMEGHWELRDSSEHILDSAQEHSQRDSYRLHVILNRPITAHILNPPDSFALIFDTGHKLTIYDSSEHYESCAIHLPDQPMIII